MEIEEGHSNKNRNVFINFNEEEINKAIKTENLLIGMIFLDPRANHYEYAVGYISNKEKLKIQEGIENGHLTIS